jgi:hypothetical protein
LVKPVAAESAAVFLAVVKAAFSLLNLAASVSKADLLNLAAAAGTATRLS